MRGIWVSSRPKAAEQEATLRTGHGKMNWFKIGKGVSKGSILLSRIFKLYAEYIMQMPGWMKQKLKSRLLEKYQQPQICR